MQRRELVESYKAAKKKIHKLNKEKRVLQEECARNFGSTSLKPSKNEPKHKQMNHTDDII